jgi:hypothetical protein
MFTILITTFTVERNPSSLELTLLRRDKSGTDKSGSILYSEADW